MKEVFFSTWNFDSVFVVLIFFCEVFCVIFFVLFCGMFEGKKRLMGCGFSSDKRLIKIEAPTADFFF